MGRPVPALDSDLAALIGAIYDAVLEPAKWHEALERICRHYNFHNSVLGIARFGHEAASLTIPVNIPERYLRAMQAPQYNEEVVRLWGGREQLARYPLEEPVVLLDIIDGETLRTNAYHRDFGEPQGLVDHIALTLTRDRRQIGNVAFGRHADFGPITADVVAGMRVLAPHLRRAALISGILAEERRQRTLLEAALNAIHSGVVLVDRKARIVYANGAATDLMSVGDPIRNDHGKLQVRGEVVPGHLQIAVHAAADGDIPLGRRGIGIPGTRTDQTPFVVHVMPLYDRTTHTGLPGDAIAAVFIADRDDDPQIVVDAATLIYSLTPAEARVFELIIAGHSSAEMAKLLAVAPSTLKWHMLQLYDKTGQHRRADLVRLAAGLRPSG
jgi:DNA-binding CsgD family transcriptional regulator/PAS domain-containing protein